MSTTFEVYAGKSVRNYCTRPTIDVPILDDVAHCTCGAVIDYDMSAAGSSFGAWVHVEDVADHRVSPRPRCTYCKGDAPGVVRSSQHAWHDATECDRCGGVDGFAIGD